jgi:trehalose-6-phosphate synthase
VANGFLWPLLHLVRQPLPELTGYFPAPEAPSPGSWGEFEAVNRAFAEAAVAERPAGQSCWVHDYQLTLVPGLLREGGYQGPVGFFLHTPFPDHEVAAPYLAGGRLERFQQCVAGILESDLAGFQTEGDVRRFRAAALAYGLAEERDGVLVRNGREVRVAAYPVGIDTAELADVARLGEFPARFAAFRQPGLPLVVGLERADYTKGIPERLRAVATAYRDGARFAYLGVAAPTRTGVAAYDRLDSVIAEEASRAHEAAIAAGVPFEHLHEAIAWPEVIALQRVADVVFTSSLADGMNLVPLQAAIAQSSRPVSERGVVITGRDAGAASVYAGFERDGLVPVDPLDTAAMGGVLRDALAGQPGRMSDRLVRAVQDHDAHAWASSFLGGLEATC